MPANKYSSTEIEYLRRAWPVLTSREVLEEMRVRFGRVLKYSQLKSTLANHKITRGQRRKRQPGTPRISVLFTDQQLQTIAILYQRYSCQITTFMFNEIYNTDFTVTQINGATKRHKILAGRTGRFEKGQTSWNKGVKGVLKANSGSFKPGHVPGNTKPIGHERICSKDGYILVKTDMLNPHTGARGFYRAKHVVVWEEQNGPVPEGHLIRFIDGDVTNTSIENLECVTRNMHVRLNQLKHRDVPEELKSAARTLAAISIKRGERKKELKTETRGDRI